MCIWIGYLCYSGFYLWLAENDSNFYDLSGSSFHFFFGILTIIIIPIAVASHLVQFSASHIHLVILHKSSLHFASGHPLHRLSIHGLHSRTCNSDQTWNYLITMGKPDHHKRWKCPDVQPVLFSYVCLSDWLTGNTIMTV